MLEVIALTAPTLVALGFYNHLHRNQLSTRKLVFNAGVFAIFINACCYLVVLYMFGNDEVVFTDKFFVKYLILATAFSLVLPFVVNLIEHTVAIEVKKNDQK